MPPDPVDIRAPRDPDQLDIVGGGAQARDTGPHGVRATVPARSSLPRRIVTDGAPAAAARAAALWYHDGCS
jgi:hypothetical protein